MMRTLLALIILDVLSLCIVCCALADLRPPLLYRVEVTLINGKSITGASYGPAGFFVGGSLDKRVRSVELSHAPGSVKGRFRFFDSPETEQYERSDDRVSELKLSVYTEYEAVSRQPGEWKYYWIKKKVQVPVADILRVDTLTIIGKGFTIFQDPALYANVKKPYLLIEDCGLGCPAKLYSDDKSMAQETLQELLGQVSCLSVSP
jgi:hypothetical protein